MECGAKRRNTDERCRAPAMANGRCRIHGGLTPRGTALPQFRHGRYSKLLPARLADRYQEMLGDQDLTSLRNDLALTEARLIEALEQIRDGVSAAHVQAIRDAFERYVSLGPSIDPAHEAAWTTLRAAVETNRGVEDDTATWREVERLTDRKARLVAAEQRHLQAAQQTITVAQAMAYAAALADAVRQHVTDPHTLVAIVRDFEQLTAR
jgi:hypothetical protein